jgi:hypothetical protein
LDAEGTYFAGGAIERHDAQLIEFGFECDVLGDGDTFGSEVFILGASEVDADDVVAGVECVAAGGESEGWISTTKRSVREGLSGIRWRPAVSRMLVASSGPETALAISVLSCSVVGAGSGAAR